MPTPDVPQVDEAPWRREAPEAFALVDAIELRARVAIDPGILAPMRAAIGTILGPDGTPELEASTISPSAAACVDFAEQFVLDVAGTTEAQRSAMYAVMGADAFTFVQVVYVSDVFRRLRIALTRLFDAPWPPARATDEDGDGDLWTLLEHFMTLVGLRDDLDPLTTELVRLRGARVHDCRICRSRLSVRALDAAGDVTVFDRIDGYEDGAFDERHTIALRLTDALVTQPSSIDAELAQLVHAHFSPSEVVEIVLDVARNAANKIAVALGADVAEVTEGVQYFDLDAAGELVADVDMAAVRTATAG